SHVSEKSATVRVQTRIESTRSTGVRTIIHDAAGNVTAETRDGTCRIDSPKLWSPDSPTMYYARSAVSVDGKAVDDYVTPFGIREVRSDPVSGLSLNGRRLKLKGVCL